MQEELRRVRSQAEEDRNAVQDITIQFESRRTSKESAAQSLERMQRQLRQFQTRQTEIRQQLEHSEAPLEDNKASLGQQLQVRIEVEEELAVARKKVESVEAELRELDQSRMQIDQSVDDARQMVSEAEMSVQEIRVRREGLAEQLSQTDFELEALLEQLDEIDHIRVKRLGTRVPVTVPMMVADELLDIIEKSNDRNDQINLRKKGN